MASPPRSPITTKAFKILLYPDWSSWQTTGAFSGAGIDLKDGYIHLSTATQAGQTYKKYFAPAATASGAEPSVPPSKIVVVEVDLSSITDPVKWEAAKSRGGALFPHVYGRIPLQAVTRTWGEADGEVNGELFERLAEERK